MKGRKNVKSKVLISVLLGVACVFPCLMFISSVDLKDIENPVTYISKTNSKNILNDTYEIKKWEDVILEKNEQQQILFDGGNGTVGNPFLISTPEQLAFMSYIETNYISTPTASFTGRMDQSLRNPNLPEEYTQLEYLESSGSEYINTGFTTATCDGFEIEFATAGIGNVNSYGLNGIFGCNGTDDDVKIWYRYEKGDFSCYIQTSGVEIPVNDVADWHKIKYEKPTVYLNDEAVGEHAIESTKSGMPLGLFSVLNKNGSSGFQSKSKVKSLKLYNEGTLVQDLVPCYQSKTFTFGMYDLVSGNFFKNLSSTGSFNGAKSIRNKNTYYKLTKDIYLNDGKLSVTEDTDENATRPYKLVYSGDQDGVLYQWSPMNAPSGVSGYSAVFNFNGHRISGMYIDSTEDYQGFIGNSTVSLKNGYFENFVVFGGKYTGGICGRLYAGPTISDLIVDGSVVANGEYAGIVQAKAEAGMSLLNILSRGFIYGQSYVGGVLGLGTQQINLKRCTNEATIIGTGDFVAGVCGSSGNGSSGGETSYCKNTGDIKSPGNFVAGVIANQRGGKFSNCTNFGDVHGSEHTGGVAGYIANVTTISDCVNYGDVNGTTYTGGVLGERNTSHNGSEKNLTNFGNVAGASIVGGVTGAGFGINFKNKGKVTGVSVVGGLVGRGRVSYGENHGIVKGTSSNIGGCVGIMSGSTMQFTCNFGNVFGGSSVAGLIGYQQGNADVISCDNHGNVYGTGDYVSSLVARQGGTASYLNISNCANYGKITGKTNVRIFFCTKNDGIITIEKCINTGQITSDETKAETLVNLFGNATFNNCLSYSYFNGVKKNLYTGDDFSKFCFDERKNMIFLKDKITQHFLTYDIDEDFFTRYNFVKL